MRNFIVRVSGGGQEKWITVTASSQADAKSRVTQAGSGWTPIAVYDNIADARSSNFDDPGLLSQIDAAEAQGFQSLGTLAFAGAGSAGFEDWASDATDSALRREAFEFGPGFEAGLSRRGINIGPGGGLEGRIAQNRQRALEDRFFAQQALQPGSALTTENAFPTFQSFLSGRTGTGGDAGWTNPLFGQAGAEAARGLLNTARGFVAPAAQALPSALAGPLLNPATVGQGQTLANIALDAGRQRFGSLSRFLPNAEALSQSFLSQDRPMTSTFADYLNQRIFG